MQTSVTWLTVMVFADVEDLAGRLATNSKVYIEGILAADAWIDKEGKARPNLTVMCWRCVETHQIGRAKPRRERESKPKPASQSASPNDFYSDNSNLSTATMTKPASFSFEQGFASWWRMLSKSKDKPATLTVIAEEAAIHFHGVPQAIGCRRGHRTRHQLWARRRCCAEGARRCARSALARTAGRRQEKRHPRCESVARDP